MKKMNRKGFTIVELVIVIAVIAILAAVMIPTFSGIVDKANESAVQQEAAALYKEAYALDLSDGKLDGYDGVKDAQDATVNKIVTVEEKDVLYTVTDGVFTAFAYSKNEVVATFDGENWTVAEHEDAACTAKKATEATDCTICGKKAPTNP